MGTGTIGILSLSDKNENNGMIQSPIILGNLKKLVGLYRNFPMWIGFNKFNDY